MFDRSAVDALLTTTRAVRMRLDLDSPVDHDEIREALAVAVQAPTGNSAEDWRFVVVADEQARRAVGQLYREAYFERTAMRSSVDPNLLDAESIRRVRDSSAYLATIMERVPILILACLEATVPEHAGGPEAARFYASIYPAVWNLQLALRTRGYGSCLTTVGLGRAEGIQRALQLPATWKQCALVPVARTHGCDFKPARRSPLDTVTRWI